MEHPQSTGNGRQGSPLEALIHLGLGIAAAAHGDAVSATLHTTLAVLAFGIEARRFLFLVVTSVGLFAMGLGAHMIDEQGGAGKAAMASHARIESA